MATMINVGVGTAKVLKVLQWQVGNNTASNVLDTGSTEAKTVYFHLS